MDCAFQVELLWSGHKVDVGLTFESIAATEQISIKPGTAPSELQQLLFGREKDNSWFMQMFALVQKASLLQNPKPALEPAHVEFVLRLKLLTMLMNLLVYRLMKMHPSETTQLIQALIARTFHPLDIARNYTQHSTITIGFPLLVKLWNSFRSTVEDQIPLRILCDALVEEQLRVFYYATKSVNCRDSKTLKEFMVTHAKRWQVTMFLLCDLYLVVQHQQQQQQQQQQARLPAVNSNSLHFIFELGHFLEWEGTIAHDLGKWPRDIFQNENNAFLFWFKDQSQTTKDMGSAVNAFLKEFTTTQERRRKSLISEKHHVESFLNLAQFLTNNVPLVQQYYKVDNIISHAKM